MRLLNAYTNPEAVRRIILEISRHAKRSCPAHSTTDKHFDEEKSDYAFEVATTTVRYGHGIISRELHHDLFSLCPKVKSENLRVAVLTDRRLSRLKPVKLVLENLEKNSISYDLYDDVRVEPTVDSIVEATNFIKRMSCLKCHALIAVGGGSVMDTAKGANLFSAPDNDPSHIMDYVNAPIGRGKPVENEELKPLIAIPTTTGTGSETTGSVIFDIPTLKAKTGITHRKLRPSLALLEPENVITLPASVATYTGFDVLCHALESFTAIPYNQRKPRPLKPAYRPAYQGSNPVSDLWARETLRLISENFLNAVNELDVEKSRPAMQLAAAYGGFGFGNAGVHLCHAMSYPISGQVRNFNAPNYPTSEPLIPHGLSVAVNAPAVFSFTGPACPDRHLEAAKILAGKNYDISPRACREDAGKILADVVRFYMFKLGIPNGLSALGFTNSDIPSLVEGTLPQHRLTKLSPIPAAKETITELFEKTMKIY